MLICIKSVEWKWWLGDTKPVNINPCNFYMQLHDSSFANCYGFIVIKETCLVAEQTQYAGEANVWPCPLIQENFNIHEQI